MSEISSLASSIKDFLNKLNEKTSELPAQASTPLTNLVDILSSAVTKQPTSTLPVQVSATVPATQLDKEELLENMVDILPVALTTKPTAVPTPLPAAPSVSTQINNLLDVLGDVPDKEASTPRVEVSATVPATQPDKQELLENMVDILPVALTTKPTAVPTPLPAAPSVSTQINNLLDVLGDVHDKEASIPRVEVPTPAQDGSTPKDNEEHLDAVLDILNHIFTTLPTQAPNGSTPKDKEQHLNNVIDILNHTFTTLPTPKQKPQCEPCDNNLSPWLPDKDSLINQINEWFKSVAAGFIPKQNIKESTYKLPEDKENYKYIGHFNVEQKDKPVYQKHISVDPDNYEIFVDETPIIPQ